MILLLPASLYTAEQNYVSPSPALATVMSELWWVVAAMIYRLGRPRGTEKVSGGRLLGVSLLIPSLLLLMVCESLSV